MCVINNAVCETDTIIWPMHTDWFLLCTGFIRNQFIPHRHYLPYGCDNSPPLSVSDWDNSSHHITHLMFQDKER